MDALKEWKEVGRVWRMLYLECSINSEWETVLLSLQQSKLPALFQIVSNKLNEMRRGKAEIWCENHGVPEENRVKNGTTKEMGKAYKQKTSSLFSGRVQPVTSVLPNNIVISNWKVVYFTFTHLLLYYLLSLQ